MRRATWNLLPRGTLFPLGLTLPPVGNRESQILAVSAQQNEHNDNPDTHGKQFFKHNLNKIIEHAPQLLQKTRDVDKAKGYRGEFSLEYHLNSRIPNKVPNNLGKAKVIDRFVDGWQVLRLVIVCKEGILGRQLEHNIQDYLSLMERTESATMAAVEEKKRVRLTENR